MVKSIAVDKVGANGRRMGVGTIGHPGRREGIDVGAADTGMVRAVRAKATITGARIEDQSASNFRARNSTSATSTRTPTIANTT